MARSKALMMQDDGRGELLLLVGGSLKKEIVRLGWYAFGADADADAGARFLLLKMAVLRLLAG